MSLRTFIRSYWMHALMAVMLLGGLITPLMQTTSAAAASCDGPRDANNNSVIWAGAYCKSEWQSKTRANNDGHGHADLQQIYSWRGITEADFMSNDTVDGVVYSNGDVRLANGQLVATDSWSGGRDKVNGGVFEGGLWMSPESATFQSNSIQAFVNMKGGVFHWAVLKACGNPVRGKAITPPPAPTPPPTPPVTPVIAYTCQSLQAKPVGSVDTMVYDFAITPKLQNVTVTGYTLLVKAQNGTQQKVVSDKDHPTIRFTFAQPGTYEVAGIISTSAGDTSLAEACKAVLTVGPTTQTPPPSPTPGQTLGTTTALPQTGPEGALAGMGAMGALGYVSRAYIRSRKSLLNTLRRK